MARLKFTLIATPTIATATGPKTIMQLVTPTNQRVACTGVDVSMNGVTSSDPPVKFDILTQTTAGTASSLTPGKVTPADGETIQSTAQQTFTSSEPTTGTVIASAYLSPLTGGFIPIPKGEILATGGTRLAVRYTSGTITGTVTAAVTMHCEE